MDGPIVACGTIGAVESSRLVCDGAGCALEAEPRPGREVADGAWHRVGSGDVVHDSDV